ncbi:hypothetical protein [Actinoplanes sp. NPDC026623]|uniref:hypothetical protein n=1 Tax=Actinoplanes sp. NPDC026623 TaxID=3155610 RepID=UPI0033BFC5F3
MDTDGSRSEIPRGRAVERVALPAGPARDLRDAVYRLYAEADCPRLDDLARAIAAADDLPGSPKKDLRALAGDAAGAEALFVQAVNRGDADALFGLIWLRERAGDTDGARRIWAYGLTGSAGLATGLEFGPQAV